MCKNCASGSRFRTGQIRADFRGYEPLAKILIITHLGPASGVLQLLCKLLQLPVSLSPCNCQLCQVSRFTPLLLTLQLGVLLLQVQQGILNKENSENIKYVLWISIVSMPIRIRLSISLEVAGSKWKSWNISYYLCPCPLRRMHFLQAYYSGS